MTEPYLGDIRLFAGSFAPNGWASCDGQLLPIAEHDALYSLIGTTYGGDGQSTFALPDLRSRVPVHRSADYPLGAYGGVESVTLAPAQVPVHGHHVRAATAQSTDRPGDAAPAPGGSYGVPAQGQRTATGPAGDGRPHENRQPYLALRFIIALNGLYPSQQ